MSGSLNAAAGPRPGLITVHGRRWPRRVGLLAAAAPLVLAPAWVAGLSALGTTPHLATLAGTVLAALLMACAYTDLEWRKIPNWATYTATIWALGLNGFGAVAGPASWLGAIGLGECLLGFAACFGTMFLVYRAAGSGAGDVKLAAAIGALVGPERGLNALVFAYLAAGLAIAAWAVWAVGPVALFGGLARGVGSRLFPGWVAGPSAAQARLLRRPVPLGAFFAIGTLVAVSGVALA